MPQGLGFSLIIAVAMLTWGPNLTADPRNVYNANSPSWLRTVGKLTVPGYKYKDSDRHHHTQHCSATLISGNMILSGWHCLEYYTDLSQDIVFTLPNRKTDTRRTAIRLTDGGGMHADWALLKLDKPINAADLKALPIVTFKPLNSHIRPLTLAGYSRDSDLGAFGQNLSYHADCAILADEIYRVATNCVAHKGASGGPVVYRQAIIGVVSVGDSVRLSYFTPSKLFKDAIAPYLR